MQIAPVGPEVGANWHLLAYNLTASGTAGYQALQALNDPVFTVKGTNYQNPYYASAFAAYAMSTNLIRCRINTPSLRLRGFPQIRPIVSAAAVPTNPNWMDMFDHPIGLRPDEDIEIDGDPGANADVITSFLWVVLGNAAFPKLNQNVNDNDLRWIRFTASITSTANLWSGANAITLEDTLEGGSYNVYGAEVYGTACAAFRIWFQNQYWKPGMLGMVAVGNRQPYPSHQTPFGLWGNFNTYSLPQLEVYTTANETSNSLVGFLLIGKSSQQFRGMSM